MVAFKHDRLRPKEETKIPLANSDQKTFTSSQVPNKEVELPSPNRSPKLQAAPSAGHFPVTTLF